MDILATPDQHEYEYPSYSTPGSAVVIIYGTPAPYADGTPSVYRWEQDMLEYDTSASSFWINEGEGWEHWIDQIDFPGPGVYVIENIVGTYHKGEWGFTDDDVDWDHDPPRPARWSDLPWDNWWMKALRLVGIDPKASIKYAQKYL